MRKHRFATTVTILVLSASLGGCATWDSMSARQKSTAVGAAVGGVAGAAISDGGILGTVGGAAIGGYVGQEMGKRR